MSTTFFYN